MIEKLEQDRSLSLQLNSSDLKNVYILYGSHFKNTQKFQIFSIFSFPPVKTFRQNVLAIRRLFSHKRIRLAGQYRVRSIFEALLSPWQKEAHNRMSNDRRSAGSDRCENFEVQRASRRDLLNSTLGARAARWLVGKHIFPRAIR